MYPILFWVGTTPFRTYTLLCILAMLASIVVVRSEAGRLGWNVRAATWLTMQATAIGFVGAHLLYALTRFDLPWDEWFWVLIRFGYGGVWFGGFLLAWAWCRHWGRVRNIPGLQMDDLASLTVLISNSVGRIGCFFNGCCFGSPTDLPWGVMLDTRDYGHAKLHPWPLYEMSYQLILFAILWRLRTKTTKDGQTASRYLIFMPLGRFLLEFLRGDSIRGFVVGWLSTSQFIALGLMAVGVFIHFRLRLSASRESSAAGPARP